MVPLELKKLAATVCVAVTMATAAPVFAQQAEPVLDVQLNALDQVDKACRMTFVVTNGLGASIGKAVFEIALFGKAGLVERLMVLDFRDLPRNRTRVRQFDVGAMECGALGRVLINDVAECTGEGVDKLACVDGLRATTSTAVEFGS